nr:hypothetical protein [Luteibacter rhizovicinus]
MPDEQAILDVAGLTMDGVALSDALLAGDLSEARFRAHLIACHVSTPSLSGVQAAAVDVLRLLGKSGTLPVAGYALAVLELSGSLDRALTLMRAS